MSTRVKTIAILVARPGKTEELKTLLESLVEPSRAESGNLKYDLWLHQSDPNSFVLDEVYINSAAVSAHRAAPYFKEYGSKIGDLADRTVFLLAPVKVA